MNHAPNIAIATVFVLLAAASGSVLADSSPANHVRPVRADSGASWRTVVVPTPAVAPSAIAAPAKGDAASSRAGFTVASRATASERPAVGQIKKPVTETASLSAATPATQSASPKLLGPGHALDGIASYYWQDQMTATGERFDKTALTAAHRTLPFGTRVRVTHSKNGQSVVVRINDRGPFKKGRVIDLSEAAAKVIGMTGAGLAHVKIDVVAAR